jgi:hypothetical protein
MPDATVAKRCGCSIKKVCIMDKYNFFRKAGLRPTEEQRLLTKLFYINANEIYSRFDDWKDNDRFYFIPLYMEMTYSMGWVAEIAPDPIWLGSFIRCNLEHPELFQITCPKCKKTLLPYRYVGSPLSGRVDLEYECECGKKGYEMVSGWHVRAIALRDQLESDKARNLKFRMLHLGAEIVPIEEFLLWLRR